VVGKGGLSTHNRSCCWLEWVVTTEGFVVCQRLVMFSEQVDTPEESTVVAVTLFYANAALFEHSL
jgi:hypothetical protein